MNRRNTARTFATFIVCLLAVMGRTNSQFKELISQLRQPVAIEVGFSAEIYPITEGDRNVTVCLETSSGLQEPVTVLIRSSEANGSNSATASLDFIPSATTLVLPPSATPTITCTNQTAAIIDDGLSLEGVEWFRVAFEFLSDTVLSDGEFILVPVLQEARVAITDNDEVTVDFSQTTLTVGEGEGEVVVCLSVDTPTATPIQVPVEAVEAAPLSATAYSDFIPGVWNITIPPSTVNDTACVPFPILEDKLAFEGQEFFLLRLHTPVLTEVQLGVNRTSAVYIIDNDDVSLTFEIVGRPEAVRPIPGETVILTCEVQSVGLVWESEVFAPPNTITFLTSTHVVGDMDEDTITGGVAVLISTTTTVVSTLTFTNVSLINTTEISCSNALDQNIRNNESLTLAGIPSPPINITVQDRACTCLNVTWTLPAFDGAAPLRYMEIQFNDVPSNGNASSVDLRIARTQSGSVEWVEVCELVPNVVYNGSVRAVSAVGASSSVEIELLIETTEPLPPTNVTVISSCSDSSLCFDGYVLVSWDPPPTDLLCPVFATRLDYTVTELESVINATSLILSPTDMMYLFPDVAPGRSYEVTLAFENEVGVSMDNPTVREDILLFRSVQLRKRSSPGTILEGDQSLYSMKLNGPPPSSLFVDLNNVDDYTRILTPQLFFNASSWYELQDVLVMATDDDVILDSPYGAVISLNSLSMRSSYEKMTNITLVVMDTDRADVIIVRKEAYPYPPDIPEGRWAVYEVTLPNRPTHPLTVLYHTLTPTVTLSPFQMTFEPDIWNIPQELTVVAIDDEINMASPYRSGFNLTLVSEDKNYGGQLLPNFNITVEDNDHDTAVVSGTLTWKSALDQGRTAVLFTLSLTLVQSYYPSVNSSSVGVTELPLPGKFEFGESPSLKVVGIYGDYIIASGSILHRYHDYSSENSVVEYEYCCRGNSLTNNQGTLLSLSVGVDLQQTTSPTLPTLPQVTLTPSQVPQQFFYTAVHPNAHPLVYSLGNMVDYHSSQGGSPQGMEISYTTGHVTWEAAHVILGNYSVQVVVEDIFTNIRTASELRIHVTLPSATKPPTILTPSPLLTHDTLYIAPGNTLSTNITITDQDSVLGVSLEPVLPLPEGAWLNNPMITGAYTVMYQLRWEPTESMIGEHVLCFVSRDGHGMASTPGCLRIIVLESYVEQPLLNLNGDANLDSIFRQTFTKGIDQSVPIAGVNSTLSLPASSPLIQHMYVSIVNYKDGEDEEIKVTNDFSHPSLSFGQSNPGDQNAPAVVYFRGAAPADVYLEALKSLVYVNEKDRPTVGDRIITVTVSDGLSTNQIASSVSYTVVSVAIENISPVVTVSGNEERFVNRFFPHKGPVAAANPETTQITDTDSPGIESMTLQLHNVRNGGNETLSVTYISSETLSLPVIAEATQLNLPFGTLWRGEVVPLITSTITVDNVGVVRDLSVIIDIRHSWVGDLRIELEHDGRKEPLVLSPGGQICSRDNLFRSTFDSTTASNVFLSKNNLSPGVCRFQSEGLFAPDGDLENFRGDAIDGDWMLHITDLLLENDNGRLIGWSLLIQPEETHSVLSHPLVVPPLKVGGERQGAQQRHVKEIELDGRITEISVHVQLGIDFIAEQLYLPSLTLLHPDGTRVMLSNGNVPFCAIGNYTNVVFDDRAHTTDYTCEGVLSGSGSGSTSGSSMGLRPKDSNATIITNQTGSGEMFVSGSASGSGSGMGLSPNEGMYLNYNDIINLNITLPVKQSLADILTPLQSLSALKGKLVGGRWTLLISSENELESTLFGWSVRVAREPNIDASYNTSTSTLSLVGADSVDYYERVLQSIVYDNIASQPDFSIQRYISTVVSDGTAVSNSSLEMSQSILTIHHIDIDLDPLNTTSAITPAYSVTFQEHSISIPILESKNAILSDEAFASGEYIMTVTLKGYQNFEREGLILNVSAANNLQATFVNDTSSQELTVVVSSAVSELQPIESFESVLRTFEYYNNAEEFIGDVRTVEFFVYDLQMNSFFVSDVAVTTISLLPTNDLPVLLLNSYRYSQSDQFSNMVDYTEGQGPLALANDTAVVLTDNDHDYLISVTVTITNPQDPLNETLHADTTGTSISSEYNVTTYTLVLNGMDSLDNYIIVLGTVTYENTVHSPGMPGTAPRQITFVPFDGTHEGVPAVALVTFAAVNDPAFGDLDGMEEGTGFNTTFTEERGPRTIVSETTTLYDVDDVTLAYIEVQILNTFDAPLEILSVMDIVESTNPGSKVVQLTNLRPITVYNPDTGTLRISGLDSVREYQEVLKTLTYNNLADEPTPTTRLITVTLNDAHSLSSPLNITVHIELVNDSPYFDPSLPQVQSEIYEDISSLTNSGIPILEVADLIIDDDVGSLKGVAVISFDSWNGTWEYTVDGVYWNQINDNISLNYALALEASEGVAIRFVPDPNWNGIVTVSTVAWDRNDGSLSGSYINAQSMSDIDAFSSDATTITVIVLPVNDAPLLQDLSLNLTDIREDEQNSTGESVLRLVQSVTDVDLPEQFGIAVISADQRNGTWQFSSDGGVVWEEFGDVNESSALLVHSLPEDAHRVRFVPDTNFNGESTFQFLAWDLTRLPQDDQEGGSAMVDVASGGSTSGQSGGSASGGSSGSGGMFISFSGSGDSFSNDTAEPTSPPPPPPYPSGTRYINTSLSDPITGSFSVNSTTVTIVIGPVNDSPVIQPGMSLRDIMEGIDSSINHGMMVSEIIRGLYSDVDTNPDTGLAVTQVNDKFGAWQYTCDSPTLGNWMTFIGGMYYGQVIPRLPQPEKATLLLSSCWVRFVPQPFFNTELTTDGYPRPVSDVPYIEVHGWDNTGLTAGRSGSYGNDATYAGDSNTNEYSSNAEMITIQVTSVNNAPILRLTNSTMTEFRNTYTEDGLPVSAVGSELTLIDNDHARLRDVTITIYGSEFDVSPFNSTEFGSASSGDTLSPVDMASGSSGSGMSGSASGSGIDSGSGMVPENETQYTPVISSTPYYPPLHQVQDYVRNLPNASYFDLYCAGLEVRREELLIDTTNLDLTSEVVSWCPFVLRLSADPGISPDAHKAMFQLALRTLRYNNSIEEPQGGERTLTFVVSDNVGLSEPVNSTVFIQLVNDVPLLDLNVHLPDVNNFVSYTEGQGPLVLPNDTALRLIDHDNLYLQGARIRLVEAPDADHEVLNASVANTNINVEFDNSTYTLHLQGNDTINAYRDVLSTVTYTNLYSHPGNPDERQRMVEFFVSDGQAESRVAITYISFTGINNRPFLDVNGDTPGVNYTTIFIEEQGPVSIVDSNLLVHDEDNRTLEYITVQLLDPIEFLLEFLQVDNVTLTKVLNQSSLDTDKVVQVTTLVPNMTYDDLNGILTISGLDTVEEYQLVLQTIVYNNLADEPVPVCRTIQFVANDGELNSNPVHTEVCVEPFNDSPRFNTSVGTVFSPLILEDQFDNDGVMVFSFAFELFEDDDSPPPGIGIAVVSLESENGEWEYSIDGTTTWSTIHSDTNIVSSALLLRAEPGRDNYVRFVPQSNFNGNASITFVAWDASRGEPEGMTRSATSRSNTDPFSNDTRTMVLRIVPVNDAPIIDTSIQPRMANIREDDVRERESFGDDVSVFLSPLIEDYDIADLSQHEFGIAVTGVDTSNGYWQFTTEGGTNWTNITSPSPSSAVVLDSLPIGSNRVRFVPNPDFNGVASLQYKLWDRNVTWPSDTVDIDTRTDQITGTFSVDTATAHITIDPVNDSPVLLGPSNLLGLQEDMEPGINFGTIINVIVQNTFIDIDGTDEVGVAVLYADRRHGDWQYTCDLGSSVLWRSFVGERLSFDSIFGQVSQVAPLNPNEFRATLLRGVCRIRFLPAQDFNTEYNLDGSRRNPTDTPYITVRGWDGTTGTNMEEGVDTTSVPDNHTNAFGREIVNVTVSVFSENDSPVLRLNGEFANYPATFIEPVPPERIVVPVLIVNQAELSLTDADNASLSFVTVSFVPYDGESERLLIDISGTTLNYTTELINDTGVLISSTRIVPDTGSSAPIGEFESVLKTLMYENSAEEPDPTNRVVSFVASDSLGFSLPAPIAEITIALTNDPPELDLGMNWPDSYRFVTYQEGEGALGIVGENTTLVDYDSPILDSARVAIVTPPDMHHEILNAQSSGSITVTQLNNGTEILLRGPGSVNEFLSVIKTVTYNNTLSEPGDPSPLSRTIQFTVSDGLNDSLPAFVYLSFSTINNAPFLDANGRQPGVSFVAMFFEEQGPVSIVSPDTVVEDIDNDTLAFIEVTILNPEDGEREVLFVDDVTETSAPLTSKHVTFWNFRPQQSYDYNTSTLTITGLDSVYEYQEVLKTLKYDNLADEPNATNRLVQFLVSDGHLSRSGVYVTIEIENVNDSPFINSSAPVFSPTIDEDINPLLNPGWSIEDVVSNGLILDDDANSVQGIAIISADIANGYWEITWDYTTDRDEYLSSQTSGSGSGTGSGSGDLGTGSSASGNGMETVFSGLRPSSGSGSAQMGSGDESDSSTMFGGSSTDDIDSPTNSSESGSGFMSGLSGLGSAILSSASGLFESGDSSGDSTTTPPTTEAPPPKCIPTTPPPVPEIETTFYATWYQLPNSTSITMATVLRADGNRTRLRFVPNKDFNGQTSFSFVAWDVSNELDNGVVTNATSASLIDPYSSGQVEVTLDILPVNDAPLLSNLTFELTSIEEDDVISYGNDVSDFLLGALDIDTGDVVFGIAIVEADEENGVWQFSTDGGRDWIAMREVCPYNATVLNSEPPGENRIRFVPYRDFNGYASFSFVAWDLTSNEASGTLGVDTTISDPITGAFSITQTSALIFVEPENDSPVLIPGSRLEAILEDIPVTLNEGTQVSDIVDGFFHDVDIGSVPGIAVTGVDLRFGTWEWRCPDSNTWTKFFGDFLYGIFVPPNPRPEKATLLDGDCRVRFLPNENFNTLRYTNGVLRPDTDLPFITILAWDTTEGSAGEYGVDTSDHNESITNEFSAEFDNVTIEVVSVNDITQVGISQNGSYFVQFTEEQPYVRIVDPEQVAISDADHARLDSVSIIVSNSLNPNYERLILEVPASETTVQLNPNNNTATVTITDSLGSEVVEDIQIMTHIYNGEPDSPPSTLTFSAPPGRERVIVEAYQTLLKFVAYTNLDPEPTNTTRLIIFNFDDSEDINSMVTTDVEILLLNDNAPVLDNPTTAVEFVEDFSLILSVASDNLTLTDFDHNEYFFVTNATLVLYPVPLSSEENVTVQISSNYEAEYNISQFYSSDDGTLRISGTAPISVYERILRTAVYQNTIEEPMPGTRMLTMQVYDGNHASNIQRVEISLRLINDQPPVIVTSLSPFVFTERTRPIAISDGIFISDNDSGGFLLHNVTITITNPLDGNYEVLSVSAFGGVSTTFQNASLVLTGPAPLSDFQATLDTLFYSNLAEEPSAEPRNISLLANDGDLDSQLSFIQVSIQLVNDLPVILIPTHELMVNYIEGSGSVSITTNATLMDNDDIYLQQLTAAISNVLDLPNEILNVTVPEGVNITSTYNPYTGLLILEGVALLADYQSTLQTLSYENLEANPGFPDTDPRMIELVAFDGKNYSLTVEVLLTFESVNDAPMLDLNGAAPGINYSVVFAEESSPVYLTTPDTVLFDIDNTTLTYIRVRIENHLDGEYEVLSVASNTSEQLDLAFYSYEDRTLLIEGLGETVNFELAVASVTYQNLADEPNFETRSISFVASDGLLESKVAYTTVEITPVNDPPRLTIAGGQRFTPPPITPEPTDPPTDGPTDGPTTSGLGSGVLGDETQQMSGSGMQEGSSSGSGFETGSNSGSGLGQVSGSGDMLMSGSGMGMDMNDTTPMTPQPHTQGPQPTIDPSSILNNVTLSNTGNFSTLFIENSPPVAIVDVNGTLIEDDDNGVLIRFEAILGGVRDPSFEAIFFDSDSLSNDLVARLFTAAPAMGGYLGDDMTCVSGSGAMKHEMIDIEVALSILEWEEVVRSLRYCNGDEHPISGTRNVTFRIQDPAFAWSDVQTTTIEVVAVNDAPICTPPLNFFTINEDSNITIPALRDCFDHEDNLTGESIFIFSEPSYGEVTVDTATGAIVYLSALNDYGTRSFAYQACDSEGFCSNPQMITIVINPVNDPPYPFENLTLYLQEDTQIIVSLSELFFGDVEDDLIPNNLYPRVINITESTISTFALTGDQNSTIMYTPAKDFFGRDQLVLEVCDSAGACVEITIEVIVESVNDDPIITTLYPEGMPPAITTEDSLLVIEVRIIDVEDRSPVDVIVVSTGNGTSLPDTSSTTFSYEPVTDRLVQLTNILYTPNQDFYGEDTITIAAIDSNGGYTEEPIQVFVMYVNDPPFFTVTQLTVVEDMVRTWKLPFDLQVSDPEDTLHAGSFEIIESTSIGNITYTYNETYYSTNNMFPSFGVLTYTPPEHYFTAENETITFVLRACDNDTREAPLCTNATIHITILSDNDAPHLPQLTLTFSEDGVGIFNLWEQITDVEDGRPPIANVFVIEPLPNRGVAMYNTTSGYLTYTPNLNDFGTDFVYYNACDSQNHCSPLRGDIEVTILEVNDPPEALDFLHIAREDDYDLIAFYTNITDNETLNLRLEIINPSDGSYLDEWTTEIGGRLRVYHAHQIITYLPPPNYVGPDTFQYAVCDDCDPRRDRELGRVDPDPQCTRQVEENGGSLLRQGSGRVYITCTEAVVNIVVSNINDVPEIGDISGQTENGIAITLTPFDNSIVLSDITPPSTPEYFYRNSSATVYDPDEQQLYLALINKLNLSLYGLEAIIDIDETSLILKSSPQNGAASVDIVNNRSQITYTPSQSFSGYESFVYEICDKQRFAADMARCTEAMVRVWVTRSGPEIQSVIADGAVASTTNIQDFDSKISKGDTIRFMFAEATNMPPYENTEQILTTSDINKIFTFDPPFFITEVTASPYTGQWRSPTEFILSIEDEGYPQPFVSQTQNGIEKLSGAKIGEWTVSASSTVGPCGGFDARGQPLANLSPYCLQSADKTSRHSADTSPPLQGDFGLKLPEISNIIVRNTAVDDSTLDVEQTNDKILFVRSQIAILLKEPLSFSQLSTYCEKDPTMFLDGSMLGDSVNLITVGCANLLSDGTVAEEVYETQIGLMRQAFSSSNRRRRDVTGDMDASLVRERRQTSIDASVAKKPVISEIVLQANNLQNPKVDPTTDPRGFVQLIADSFNEQTLADVVFETLGVPVSLLVDHTNNAAPQVDPFFYLEADDELTPQILRVEASDPDNVDDVYGADDLITIFFDRNTDQPTVDTRVAIDGIFVFYPPLGAVYTGMWITPSVLQITIVDPTVGEGVPKPSTNPLNFNLTFTPNYFHTGAAVTSSNVIVPTETPWCIGINVCGQVTTTGATPQSIGICNENQRSCRAYQGWTSLEGNFGTAEPIVVPVFPWWWILLVIVVVVVIVIIIIVVVFCYRYYKRKAQRKEALRVVRRWKKDQFAPGKEADKKEGPQPWVKPPDVSAMRDNPDPFSALQKLPEVVPRPPTAFQEVENLPPIPQQPFKPRGPANIRPSLGSLQSVPPLPRTSRTINIGSIPQLGLPPLTRQLGDTPSRVDRRTTLPPLKGGGTLSTQARRALGEQPGATGGVPLPGALIPRNLPPINLPRSPTTLRPSLGAPPIFLAGKGKGPSNGKLLPKKASPYTSSEEDVSSSEVTGAGSGSALPPLSPTSPPFKTTRPLPAISSLPPISGPGLPPVARTTGNLPRLSLPTSPGAMPSRRTSVDPFTADSAPPTSPTRRVTAAPLSPIRSLPPRGRTPPTPQTLQGQPKSPRTLTNIKEETKREGEVPKTEDGDPKE